MAVLFRIAKNWKLNVHQQLNRQTVVQLYNSMLFSNKKEQITDTSSNMEKSQNHYAQSKKTNTKGYIDYDSIYKIFLKSKTTSTKKQINSC